MFSVERDFRPRIHDLQRRNRNRAAHLRLPDGTDDPTDGLHDPSRFFVYTLPWLLLRPDGEYARLVSDDGGVAVVLFTDADLAREAAAGIPGSIPTRAAGWPALHFHIEALATQGVTHVAFDPTPGRGRAAGIFPVAVALHYIRQRE